MRRKMISAAVLFVFLGGLIVSEMFPHHTPENEADTEPGWMKHSSEAITFNWYINYSWFSTSWGENLVSQTITEETGVSVNFITPSGNASEKLNALIASDSLPDLVTLGWWEPQVSQMIQSDLVYALNELADEYDVYFWQVTDEVTVKWYTEEDGNIYCYPNSSYTPHDLAENDNISSNINFLVRKDIYEAIDSPDMTTREGFQAAVKKAAESFPTVDGDPLIPIGAHEFDSEGCVSFDKYLMNFLAVPFEKDGMYYDRYTDEQYIKWLKMFRELGEEGYLANDIFIDQRTQMEEKLAAGRYFCMFYQNTDIANQQKTLYANNPDSIYIAVDGPKNDDGDDYTLPTGGVNGWTVTLISKNCDQADRAIQFMDYLLSEHGQMLTYLGVEGVTYDLVDGKPVVKEEVQELLNTDRAKYDELYGADDAYWMLQDNVVQLKWKQQSFEPMAQLEKWTYPYVVYNGQYDALFPTDSLEYNQGTKITELWAATLPRLLLADSEKQFDMILAEFVERREDLGFSNVQNARTKLMKEAKERLGIE